MDSYSTDRNIAGCDCGAYKEHKTGKCISVSRGDEDNYRDRKKTGGPAWKYEIGRESTGDDYLWK
jgi:hypothetical protein